MGRGSGDESNAEIVGRNKERSLVTALLGMTAKGKGEGQTKARAKGKNERQTESERQKRIVLRES
jgi:hypothetical protein